MRSARLAMVAVGAAVLASAAMGVSPAGAAPGPVADPTSAQLTTDVLPTVQQNGVVWAEAVVGNTVYVGGDFSSARPAGSDPGVNEVPRANLLAFDITTGVLIDSFQVATNGPVYALAVSPDQTRLYVGGAFTQIAGATRSRIAALNLPSGALNLAFKPSVNTTVRSISANNTSAYFGGDFTSVNGNTRNHLANVTSAGALTAWAPSADALVRAVLLSPDGSTVVVAGSQATLNGTFVGGLGGVNSTTGATVPWKTSQSVYDYGSLAAFYSLSTDGTTIFASAYRYSKKATGNLEGVVGVSPVDGTITWMEDCHGDVYGTFSAGGAVYTVGHAHDCAADGGFVNVPGTFYRAMAYTRAVTGTLNADTTPGYWNHAGQPSPSIINWFPDLTPGSITGQVQAAWTIAGNSQYAVLGGEFPKVNGVHQQGLVRFAVRTIAPKLSGPIVPTGSTTPTVTQTSSTSVRVTLPGYWDRDGLTIRYNLIRDGQLAPVATSTLSGTFWSLPNVVLGDSGLTPGSTHTYRVRGYDEDGRSAAGSVVTFTLH